MEQEQKNKSTCEVCLQDLRAYNEGILYFKWYSIDDFDTIEEVYQDFKNRAKKDLKYIPEEIMICDYSNFPNMGEYPDLEELRQVWKALREDSGRAEAIKDFIEHGHNISDFEEAYQGNYKDMGEFAEQLISDCYDLDKMMGNLSYYFDFDKYGRDLEYSGDYWISQNGNVFRSL